MVTSVSGNPVVRKPRKHDETDLMRTIHDTLVRVGVTMWRNNVGIATWQSGGKTRYGLGVGSADLIGCYRGRFVAVEVKSPSGRQSPEQACWQRAVEAAGGLYVLARPGPGCVEEVVRTVTGKR